MVPSGVTRDLSQGENLAERGRLATVGDPLANNQKKTWEMMVHPNVVGYTKTIKHRKILRKTQNTQPTEIQNNPKTEI